MSRIGIYAGSFDPVHDGHVAFAREAIKQCKLDKLLFLVEPRPRRKQGVKAYEHRMEMVKIAIAHEKHMASILLEQQRFSIQETLPILEQRFKGMQMYMLLGDDVLWHLVEWPHVDMLLATVHFVIGVRTKTKSQIDKYISELVRIRGINLDYTIVELENLPFSSTKTRLAIKRGHTPKGIDSNVLKYIEKQKLYVSSKPE